MEWKAVPEVAETLPAPSAGRRLRAWAETGLDAKPMDRVAVGVRDLIERMQDAPTAQALVAIYQEADVRKQVAWLKENRSDKYDDVERAYTEAMAVVAPDDAEDAA